MRHYVRVAKVYEILLSVRDWGLCASTVRENENLVHLKMPQNLPKFNQFFSFFLKYFEPKRIVEVNVSSFTHIITSLQFLAS